MSEKAVTFENRGLFSNHYLENKLAENNKLWLDREKEIQKTFDECKKIFNEAMKFNLGVGEEASLEEHLIRPIFKVLGFEYTVQAPINNMHADYALYLSEENKLKGERDKNNLWDYAQVVGEVKYYGRRLNDTEKGKGKSSNDPTRQIFGYLNDLNKVLNKNIDWGILTNGQKWRLFKYISNPLANYYEVNLEQIIQSNNLDQFKYFYLFFSKNAFVEDPQTNESWLDIFIKGSEEYAKVIQEKIKNL
ncbi:MAG: hypothetical protein OEV44_15135, partial [Spirochaetota bacterium]|nr:hypothetical protein [Spirochaetota bacterium]